MFSLHYFFFVATLYLCIILLRFSSLDTAVLAEETITSLSHKKVSSDDSKKLRKAVSEKPYIPDLLLPMEFEEDKEIHLTDLCLLAFSKIFSAAPPKHGLIPSQSRKANDKKGENLLDSSLLFGKDDAASSVIPWYCYSLMKYSKQGLHSLDALPATLGDSNLVRFRPLQQHKEAMLDSLNKSIELSVEKLNIFYKRISQTKSRSLQPITFQPIEGVYLLILVARLQEMGVDEDKVKTLLDLISEILLHKQQRLLKKFVPEKKKILLTETLADVIKRMSSCQRTQILQEKSVKKALNDGIVSGPPYDFFPSFFSPYSAFIYLILKPGSIALNFNQHKKHKTMSLTQETEKVSSYFDKLIISMKTFHKQLKKQQQSQKYGLDAEQREQLESLIQRKAIAHEILKKTNDYFFCTLSSDSKTLEPMKEVLPKEDYLQILKEFQSVQFRMYRDMSEFFLHSQLLVAALEKKFAKIQKIAEMLEKSSE